MKTKTGISPFLPDMFRQIATEHPDFVLHAGDVISGEYTSDDAPIAGNFAGMYGNFMHAASPVYNYSTHTGIPIYTVRGNHDNGNQYEGNASLQAAYVSSVAQGLPDNGPEGEKTLTYSFVHKGIQFIGLDEYLYRQGKTGIPNMDWLSATLNANESSSIIVWGHSPAFAFGSGIDPYPMYLFTDDRDLFWQNLTDNHCLMYFCGHVHQYARGEVDGTLQILCGNGGGIGVGINPANADPLLQISYPTHAISAKEQRIGYLLVTVDPIHQIIQGTEKQFNPVLRKWENIDSFTLENRKNFSLF